MRPVNALLSQLLEELGEGIPDVLTQEFSFAMIWADLCRLASEPVPGDVAAVLDARRDVVPAAPVYRGSHAAHTDQFAELYADCKG